VVIAAHRRPSDEVVLRLCGSSRLPCST
jgi:hypothetical protein